MTRREAFLAAAKGRRDGRAPFFPDITSWYVLTRIPLGDEQPYFPGQYIPDDSPIHELPSRLSGPIARLTFVDFYRTYGWGLPVHAYDWCDETLADGVEKVTRTEERHRTVTFHTPRGDLARTYKLDAEGTWSEYGHMAQSIADLAKVRCIVESTRFVPHPERVERFLRETAGFGVADLVIYRSPFGKLIHEYMGFEQVAYSLYDDEQPIVEFLQFQEEKDLELIRLAARAPGSIVIISDHADENLISPAWYRTYCIPFYRKACAILHAAGQARVNASRWKLPRVSPVHLGNRIRPAGRLHPGAHVQLRAGGAGGRGFRKEWKAAHELLLRRSGQPVHHGQGAGRACRFCGAHRTGVRRERHRERGRHPAAQRIH